MILLLLEMQKVILFVVKHVQSMLVTDVGDEMCWWRFWPFWSPTSIVFYISVGHQHSRDVTNITVTKKHLKERKPKRVWKMEMITIILCLMFQVELPTTHDLWTSRYEKLKVSAVKILGIKVQFSRTQVIIFYLICFFLFRRIE